MCGKFESRFKGCDESTVNAAKSRRGGKIALSTPARSHPRDTSRGTTVRQTKRDEREDVVARVATELARIAA